MSSKLKTLPWNANVADNTDVIGNFILSAKIQHAQKMPDIFLSNFHQISNFLADFHEAPNIKFRVNTSSGSRADTDRRTVIMRWQALFASMRKCQEKKRGRLRLAAARFDVLTAVFMKSEIVWDMTPCHLVYSYQSFGEGCCLHLWGCRS